MTVVLNNLAGYAGSLLNDDQGETAGDSRSAHKAKDPEEVALAHR